MLTINKTQMSAFQDSLIRAFEERTYAHLKLFFPRHCLLLGEEPMRKIIRQGWQKAQSYDLTAECCVRSYIEFTCRLGSGFDTDPLLPWAARILNDKTTLGQVERGDRLYDQAWDYIDHISQDYRDPTGKPTTARFMDELRNLRHGRDIVLTQSTYPDARFMDELRNLRHGRDIVLTQSTYPDFAREMAWRFETIFPAKCQYIGEQRVQNLIPRGVRSARAYGIATERGIILFTLLMFVLGNGFADDPLLPWASATLSDQRVANEIDRVDRLYAEGVGFLKRWWDSAPERGD
ncbi:MAG: hypothetical protein PHE55_03215 [Methylococcaceae bacterium]|nr:hypothetical protein [Methylococcaceae bacterium]